MDIVAYWQKNCAPYLRAIFGAQRAWRLPGRVRPPPRPHRRRRHRRPDPPRQAGRGRSSPASATRSPPPGTEPATTDLTPPVSARGASLSGSLLLRFGQCLDRREYGTASLPTGRGRHRAERPDRSPPIGAPDTSTTTSEFLRPRVRPEMPHEGQTTVRHSMRSLADRTAPRRRRAPSPSPRPAASVVARSLRRRVRAPPGRHRRSARSVCRSPAGLRLDALARAWPPRSSAEQVGGWPSAGAGGRVDS